MMEGIEREVGSCQCDAGAMREGVEVAYLFFYLEREREEEA